LQGKISELGNQLSKADGPLFSDGLQLAVLGIWQINGRAH
jgi:hypothetical protein